MELAVNKIGEVGVAEVLVDELDAANAPDFKRDITLVVEAHTKLVLDLSRLRFVDSSGLGAILSCLRQVSAKGGDVKLCCISKRVCTSFDLMRMHRIFDIYPTRADALSAFEQ